MGKLVGYILALVGMAGITLYSVPKIQNLIPLPASLVTLLATKSGGMIILVISLVIFLAGVFMLSKGSSGKQAPEVPIYSGKNIVGYRRMGKR